MPITNKLGSFFGDLGAEVFGLFFILTVFGYTISLEYVKVPLYQHHTDCLAHMNSDQVGDF